MINPTEHKLQVITCALQLIENSQNSAKRNELITLITEHGKIYHVNIKSLKTAKKPLLRTLINFAEGLNDMQSNLNELNHSIK